MPKFHDTKPFRKRMLSLNVNDNALTLRHLPTCSKNRQESVCYKNIDNTYFLSRLQRRNAIFSKPDFVPVTFLYEVSDAYFYIVCSEIKKRMFE